MHHYLKTDPAEFEAIFTGKKTYECRVNDRDFQVGDSLTLNETKFSGFAMLRHPEHCPLVYTNRRVRAVITYVSIPFRQDPEEEYPQVIMSIKVKSTHTVERGAKPSTSPLDGVSDAKKDNAPVGQGPNGMSVPLIFSKIDSIFTAHGVERPIITAKIADFCIALTAEASAKIVELRDKEAIMEKTRAYAMQCQSARDETGRVYYYNSQGSIVPTDGLEELDITPRKDCDRFPRGRHYKWCAPTRCAVANGR